MGCSQQSTYSDLSHLTTGRTGPSTLAVLLTNRDASKIHTQAKTQRQREKEGEKTTVRSLKCILTTIPLILHVATVIVEVTLPSLGDALARVTGEVRERAGVIG